jgi:hypothetical protein
MAKLSLLSRCPLYVCVLLLVLWQESIVVLVILQIRVLFSFLWR